MKFLHTSDWHVGRTVRGRSRDSEHEAALAQVLGHAREQAVDCLLVAGDVFDSSAPSAESEKIVYSFFRELHGAGIPAVMIAGNHDHPKRFEALAPLLRAVRIHLIGEPKEPGEGGVFEIESRDAKERALVAALPWVTERSVVDFSRLQVGAGGPLVQYAYQVARGMASLAGAFRPASVNVLVAHVLVNNAKIGRGGGERELHLDMGIYGVNPRQIPSAPQYAALGHVHRPQDVRRSPAAAYSGSLLQLDFGEVDQAKSVNLVEVHPGQPAQIERLPITAGRPLRDIGSPLRGVALNDISALAAQYGDAWFRVFVDVDVPIANLAALVRDQLANAVHIERVTPLTATQGPVEPNAGKAPVDLFADFYAGSAGRGRAPADATLSMFRQLHDEVLHEDAEA